MEEYLTTPREQVAQMLWTMFCAYMACGKRGDAEVYAFGNDCDGLDILALTPEAIVSRWHVSGEDKDTPLDRLGLEKKIHELYSSDETRSLLARGLLQFGDAYPDVMRRATLLQQYGFR